jgi:hypothetical protein
MILGRAVDMLLKLIALFVLAAAVGYVVYSVVSGLIYELGRDWNTGNWWSE